MENRVRCAFVLLLALVAFAQSHPSADTTGTAITAAGTPAITVTPPASPSTPSAPHPVDANAVINSAKATPESNSSKLSIEVYYEAMCIDCVQFFKQLLPVYQKMNQLINVTFIPFALADITTNDTNVTLECKREGECNADKVHACSIAKIKDNDKLVEFLKCSLVEGFKNKTVPIEECAINSNIGNDIITAINACITSDNTSSEWYPLLNNYSKTSRAIPVHNVPTVVFNKTYSLDDQKSSIENFKKAVCVKTSDKSTYCSDVISGSSTVVVGVLPILFSVYYFIRLF